MYDSAKEFRDACQMDFARYVAEGVERSHLDMTPDYLCVHSETLEDYDRFKLFAAEIGQIATRLNDGREITWVFLHDKLVHEPYTLNWLEITQPDPPEIRHSRPSALVLTKEKFGTPVDLNAYGGRYFVFRYRQHSAEEILSL